MWAEIAIWEDKLTKWSHKTISFHGYSLVEVPVELPLVGETHHATNNS